MKMNSGAQSHFPPPSLPCGINYRETFRIIHSVKMWIVELYNTPEEIRLREEKLFYNVWKQF
jgi:hypothetical protein